jgi:chromosome segregation ATPase
VALALGKNGRGVVVADDDTCHRSIAWLKENKAGTMTFLPLTSVQVRAAGAGWWGLVVGWRGVLRAACC